ncbi:endonuclease domain-containing protein [Pedobacter sp. KR3-3]|uniref:Endonuclease domain-containing protein n=1 Tax=Pedobacter albus TaxID=3113905 RepID=A0ABU7IB13_9SPHI|nr:endonuclease domain-containing protein [Pedobacter sp. KR3-3]MEE1946652.1 endonuclease domain-containing protein [Pedobacter sp. KR3-3]
MPKPLKILQALEGQNSPPLEGCPKGGVVEKPIMINGIIINQAPSLELPYNPKLKERAKELRYARNLPEVLFWQQVHKRKFYKMDFDRQRVVGNYIVDFYCKQLGLVVEIDGASHHFDGDYDEQREKYLVAQGLKIYRISVHDILRKMEFVLMGLENFIVENYS